VSSERAARRIADPFGWSKTLAPGVNNPASTAPSVMANRVPRSLVIVLGAAVFAGLNGSAFAQANAENKPPEQQNAEANKTEAAHFADVAHAVSGAAANPECIHLGENAVILMAKNDLDTAQRHINLYDRFGCPGLHLRLSYRCLLNVGMPSQKDEKPTLESRVKECWINPNMTAASAQTGPAAASGTPAPTLPAAPAPHPSAPPAPATAGTGAH
jgi:hypothetical protein